MNQRNLNPHRNQQGRNVPRVSQTASATPAIERTNYIPPAKIGSRVNQAFFTTTTDEQSLAKSGGQPIHRLLVKCLQSGVLKLTHQGYRKLPREVYHIHEVSFEGKEWWNEVDMHRLDVSYNELEVMDDEIELLTSLRAINLNHNNLRGIPRALLRLPDLLSLSVTHNKLAQLPLPQIGTPCCYANLTELNLNDNVLDGVPGEILQECKCLEYLHLAGNKLPWFPLHEMGNFSPRLQVLDLSRNQIRALETPPVANGEAHATPCKFSFLQELNLSDNLLGDAVHAVQDLLAPKLHTLNLTRNRLEVLPFRISSNLELIEILMSHNRLKAFPEGIPQSVQVLEARDNQISSDLSEITALRSLKRVDATNNSISNVDPRIGSFPHLTHFLIDGNPMRGIRREIIQKGTLEVLKYLRMRQSNVSECAPQPCSLGDTCIGTRQGTLLDLSCKETPSTGSRRAQNTRGGESANTLCRASFPTQEELVHILGPDTSSWATIKTVCMRNHALQEFPDAVCSDSFRNAMVIDFSANRIQRLNPEALGTFRSLTTLVLSRNQLESFSGQLVADLPALTFLDISFNRITNITSLTDRNSTPPRSLVELNISHNQLQEFPEFILDCTSLTTLFMNDNKIRVLRPEIPDCLGSLNTFNIANNNLTDFPPRIGLLTALHSLKVEGNAIRWLRSSLLQQGTPALLRYLRDKIPDPNCL